jgi:spermidine synthase
LFPKRSNSRSIQLKVLIYSTFVAGLCSIVYELLIATTGSYFLGDSIRQFSLVIGFYMASMGVGSYVSRLVPERGLLQTFVTIEVVLGLVGGLSVPLLYFSFAYLGFFQLAVLLATSVVGLLIGLEIPLLSRLMSRDFDLKDNISNVLSLDYLGALVATLLFPFLFLPLLGVFKTSLAFGLINMSIGFAVVYVFADVMNIRQKRVLYFYSASALAMLLLVFIFSKTLLSAWTEAMYEDRVVYARETPYQHIVMTKDKEDVRLFLNGNLQFSSIDEYRYHESLVHIPMLSCRCQKILMLGGGDGLAVREVLKYPSVEEITLVDLDPGITQLAQTNALLTTLNQRALAHQKVEVVNEDAFVFLGGDEQQYDLIVIDLPDPNNTALARLYSREFYWLVKARLAAGGRFVTQATSPYYATKAFWSIHETIKVAGLDYVMPYHISIPSFGEWGFILASDTPLDLEPKMVDVSTRYLEPGAIERAFFFEKDLIAADVKASSLDSPSVLKYYLDGWAYWR